MAKNELFSDDPNRLQEHERQVKEFLAGQPEPNAETSTEVPLVPLQKGVELKLSAFRHPELIDSKSFDSIQKIFSKLPSESQDQILQDVNERRKNGEDPRQLMVRLFSLIKTHREFALLGHARHGDEDDKEDESEAERALEEILERLHGLQKEKSGGKEQLDLPFEQNEEKDSHDNIPPWVN